MPSTTSQHPYPDQQPAAQSPRLAYRASVVEMFRQAAEPELARADTAIADKRAAIAKLQDELASWENYVAEICQVLGDVESNAALPAVALGTVAKCRPCGAQLVRGMGQWLHSGRELFETGHLCFPDRTDSTVAIPEGELSPDPDGAIARLAAAHDAQDAAERGRA